MKDYDARIRGIDANQPNAPWNIYFEAAAAHARTHATLRESYSHNVPRDDWNRRESPPVFPIGLVETLGDLVTHGARIVIIAGSAAGKSTLQYAVHASLSVPSALAVSTHFDRRRYVGQTMLYLDDVAPLTLPTDVGVASWYEFLACGHLFRQFHGAPTICTTRRAECLARWWSEGRGGTVTVPIPSATAGHALADLRLCFPDIAELTTHIVTIRGSGDLHTYELHQVLSEPRALAAVG